MIVAGSTPAVEVTDASKVVFASKDVRGKMKKLEFQFKLRLYLANSINYFSNVKRDFIFKRKPSKDDLKRGT